MATHNGNRLPFQSRAGRVIPMNRVQGPALPAAVFEAVGATSSIRTVRRDADAAMRIWTPFTVEADSQARVVHSLLRQFDARMWVVRFPQYETDISVLVIRPFSTNGDTRQAVSAAIERHTDTEQRMVHQLESDFDIGQTIFAVLINESHAIQT